MERRGRAHVLPDDIDTDQIIPAEYLNDIPEEDYGDHVLEGYDSNFPTSIEPGDILVAGENFGLGSSREGAPIAIRNAGIGAVIAESFARIFYRNCFNVGLPIVTVVGITDRIDEGDVVRIDIGNGRVENETSGETFSIEAIPPDLLEILEAGGLVAYRQQQRG